MLETSPGRVEPAILHMAELEGPNHAEQRLAAMLNANPVHTVLFSQTGQVLAANKVAADKMQRAAGTLKS